MKLENLIDASLAALVALGLSVLVLALIFTSEPSGNSRRGATASFATNGSQNHRGDDRPPPPLVEIPKSLIWGQ